LIIVRWFLISSSSSSWYIVSSFTRSISLPNGLKKKKKEKEEKRREEKKKNDHQIERDINEEIDCLAMANQPKFPQKTLTGTFKKENKSSTTSSL